MVSSELNSEQLVKEIRKINKNLSRRLNRIEKRGLEVSAFAINQYKELKEKMPKGKELRKLDKNELQSYYRDIKYINSLKTSTVKGALNTKNRFEPVQEKLNALSQDKRDKFWEIYGKLYSYNPYLEKFKYEIFDESIDEVYAGEEPDKYVLELINEYDAIVKGLGSKVTDNKIKKKLFTNRIDKMYK